MPTVTAHAEQVVDAPAETVYDCIADMRNHHPNFLPPAFSDFEVESGGIGAGTVTTFKFTAGGRTRAYRMAVAEPEPGRILTESDTNSSLVTSFTVTPGGADRCTVRIDTQWEGAGGVGGFFERVFAPKALKRLYRDELDRLGEYAKQQAAPA
ncbi:MAG TPA: SRPBCC family protein [Solirubrobacteraceae bacterium]|jgi:hypothetical protein